MYLKRTKQKNGRIHLDITDSYYDKQQKKTRQITIENLGFLDELEKLYDDPISHFTKRVEQLKIEKRPDKLPLTLPFMIPTDCPLPIPDFVKISVMPLLVRFITNLLSISSSSTVSVILRRNTMPTPS